RKADRECRSCRSTATETPGSSSTGRIGNTPAQVPTASGVPLSGLPPPAHWSSFRIQTTETPPSARGRTPAAGSRRRPSGGRAGQLGIPHGVRWHELGRRERGDPAPDPSLRNPQKNRLSINLDDSGWSTWTVLVANSI